ALFASSAKQHAPNSLAPQWLWLPGLFALGALAGLYCALQGLAINPEPIIGFSVLFWGVLLVVRTRLHLAVQAIAAVLFAFFHGLAHGPVVSEIQAPAGFYAGLSIGFGLCFGAGFFATTYLTAATARKLAGLVSLAGLSYFFAAG
ncbi:MAG TPA: HupE/UreJ family protein, partial [Marinagarivorans sp.]|nr:HupE/UreJ family protein [Marinagarivorans sp.]